MAKMGVGSAVFLILFSIVWTITALGMMSGMGVFFTLVGMVMFVYGVAALAAALRRSRTRASRQETAGLPDQEPPVQRPRGIGGNGMGYCPYCGSPLESDYEFCAVCGRRLS